MRNRGHKPALFATFAAVVLFAVAGPAYAYPSEAHERPDLQSSGDVGGCDVWLDFTSGAIPMQTKPWDMYAENYTHCGGLTANPASIVSTARIYSLSRSWPPVYLLERHSDGGCGACNDDGSYAAFTSPPPGDYKASHHLEVSLGNDETWTSYPSNCAVTATYPYNKLTCNWSQYVTQPGPIP
jgi:hypothetical protein